MKKSKTVRLAKFLATCGVASRRKAEELIVQGKVKVNGKVVTEVSTNVPSDITDVKVNNKPVKVDRKVYYLVNKPVGYVSTVKDPHNSKTVVSLVPRYPKVVPVGRLDKDSKGLLLLTNDGDLVYELTHPKFEVTKTYLVKVNKDLDKDIKSKLLKGVQLDEGLAKADKVRILNSKELEITIHQGWNRQIRRMLGNLNCRVISLTRTVEGKLKLNKLASGKYIELKKKDIV